MADDTVSDGVSDFAVSLNGKLVLSRGWDVGLLKMVSELV